MNENEEMRMIKLFKKYGISIEFGEEDTTLRISKKTIYRLHEYKVIGYKSPEDLHIYSIRERYSD